MIEDNSFLELVIKENWISSSTEKKAKSTLLTGFSLFSWYASVMPVYTALGEMRDNGMDPS